MEPDKKKLPNAKFRTLESLERYKRLCLFLPIKKIRKGIPWGYKVDPNDSSMYLPEEKAIEVYIKAKEYLKTESYETMAAWMTSQGFPTSDDGVKRLVFERPIWNELLLPYEERLKL